MEMWVDRSCTFFLLKHNPAYELRISDWISVVCSSDLCDARADRRRDAAQRVVFGLAAREHRARTVRDRRCRDAAGVAAFGHAWLHGPARQRLRPQARRSRRWAVGRPAPIDRACPRARRPPADSDLRPARQRDGPAERIPPPRTENGRRTWRERGGP